jgi:hypothetical protein
MNKSTAAKDETHIADGAKYIGFLDIFGFEKMTPNSLEQLCINYANEELQNLFNDSTFQQEMEVYKQEQVDVGDLNKCATAIIGGALQVHGCPIPLTCCAGCVSQANGVTDEKRNRHRRHKRVPATPRQ